MDSVKADLEKQLKVMIDKNEEDLDELRSVIGEHTGYGDKSPVFDFLGFNK